jgi:glycosyltransferase involved in cell wall biosynthesis
VVFDGLPLPPLPTVDDRRQAREALRLPLNRLIVIIAGQVIERKGIADLIQAWSLLSAECRALAELLVAGDDLLGHGEYRRAMEELAAERNVPARFVGFQKNIGQWLTACDVATVPSHVEPMANANIEAMSYGLPLVSSRVGGIPEAVLDGETGLLVPPKSPAALAEALTRLLTDEPLRLRLGQQGRRRCEELFSIETHARNILDEYCWLVGRACWNRRFSNDKESNRGPDMIS